MSECLVECHLLLTHDREEKRSVLEVLGEGRGLVMEKIFEEVEAKLVHEDTFTLFWALVNITLETQVDSQSFVVLDISWRKLLQKVVVGA